MFIIYLAKSKYVTNLDCCEIRGISLPQLHFEGPGHVFGRYNLTSDLLPSNLNGLSTKF